LPMIGVAVFSLSMVMSEKSYMPIDGGHRATCLPPVQSLH
jgi:hypothetical protein